MTGWGCQATGWNFDETLLYFAPNNQDYLFYSNVSNNFSVSSSSNVYRPTSQYTAYQIHFLA
jgi:hypothetical protein